MWTPGKIALKAVGADPDDDAVIACAVEGKADYIITGDQHLLNLKDCHRIPIVSPAAFLQVWSETGAREADC